MPKAGYRQKCLAQKINVCNVCGESEKLVVHHIDGDRSNNRLDNLVPLCRSCHSKVHAPDETHPMCDYYTEQLPESSLNLGNRKESDKERDWVTIPIDPEVRDELRGFKVGNETYSEVIERLMEGHNATD